jgi:hypothetical protein
MKSKGKKQHTDSVLEFEIYLFSTYYFRIRPQDRLLNFVSATPVIQQHALNSLYHLYQHLNGIFSRTRF